MPSFLALIFGFCFVTCWQEFISNIGVSAAIATGGRCGKDCECHFQMKSWVQDDCDRAITDEEACSLYTAMERLCTYFGDADLLCRRNLQPTGMTWESASSFKRTFALYAPPSSIIANHEATMSYLNTIPDQMFLARRSEFSHWFENAPVGSFADSKVYKLIKNRPVFESKDLRGVYRDFRFQFKKFPVELIREIFSGDNPSVESEFSDEFIMFLEQASGAFRGRFNQWSYLDRLYTRCLHAMFTYVIEERDGHMELDSTMVREFISHMTFLQAGRSGRIRSKVAATAVYDFENEFAVSFRASVVVPADFTPDFPGMLNAFRSRKNRYYADSVNSNLSDDPVYDDEMSTASIILAVLCKLLNGEHCVESDWSGMNPAFLKESFMYAGIIEALGITNNFLDHSMRMHFYAVMALVQRTDIARLAFEATKRGDGMNLGHPMQIAFNDIGRALVRFNSTGRAFLAQI